MCERSSLYLLIITSRGARVSSVNGTDKTDLIPPKRAITIPTFFPSTVISIIVVDFTQEKLAAESKRRSYYLFDLSSNILKCNVLDIANIRLKYRCRQSTYLSKSLKLYTCIFSLFLLLYFILISYNYFCYKIIFSK